MARASSSSTKFASVNLNKSYGKPAAPQGAQLPGSGGSRTRIASHGGMLLLTRPVRSASQPAAAAAVLHKGGKLTVPLPVNLPSLRREHAGNDPNIALVGGATGASGWPKQQQQQPPQQPLQPQQQPGEAVAEEGAPNDSFVVQGESNAGGSRSTPALSAGSTWGTSQPPLAGQPAGNPGANGELRPSSAPHLVARSGVYTPPRARTVPVKVNVVSVPVRPIAVEKAVVLRGEDFPTLQAALPPAPPPSQQRQKELQQKQREKQQELKDQHQKLQLLSQKPAGEEPLQPQQVVAPPLQPAQPVPSAQAAAAKPPQSLSPDSSGLSLEPQVVQQQQQQQAGGRPGFKPEGFSSYGGPLPPVRPNQRSNWTDDEREPAQNLRPQGGGQGQYSDWPDRPEREQFFEDPRRNSRGAEDYGFGRQSSQRESRPASGGGGFGRDMESGRDGGGFGGFGRDMESGRDGGGFGGDGGFQREGNPNSSYSLPNNHNREERYGREVMGRRDGMAPGGRDGGGYNNRDPGVGRDGLIGLGRGLIWSKDI